MDHLTDFHPAVVALRGRWRRPLRRYAPILIDLGLDHSLARCWGHHHDLPLEQFARLAQASLLAQSPHFPEPLRSRLDGFAELLLSYARPEGLLRALQGTASRLRRPYEPDAAMRLLCAEGSRLDALLALLLPELRAQLEQELADGLAASGPLM